MRQSITHNYIFRSNPGSWICWPEMLVTIFVGTSVQMLKLPISSSIHVIIRLIYIMICWLQRKKIHPEINCSIMWSQNFKTFQQRRQLKSLLPSIKCIASGRGSSVCPVSYNLQTGYWVWHIHKCVAKAQGVKISIPIIIINVLNWKLWSDSPTFALTTGDSELTQAFLQ